LPDGTGYDACSCTGDDGGPGSTDARVDQASDAPADQAVEPTGPVLVGTAPQGRLVGMVVENDVVLVGVTVQSGSGPFTFNGSVVAMPAAGGGSVQSLATGPLAPGPWQTGNLVAASATDVFYLNVNVATDGGADTFDIMKTPRNGGAAPTKFKSNAGSVVAMQHYGGYLYWLAPNGIRRSPVGSLSETGVVGNPVGGDFVIAGAYAYYGYSPNGNVGILRAPVTGGAGSPIVTDSLSSAAISLTLDPAETTFVYHDYSPNGTVYRAPLAGAATGTLVTAAVNPGAQTPRTATDGTRVFYITNSVLKWVPIGGGASTDIVANQDPAFPTNYGNHIYWFNRANNTVWRMRKP
jgi:hypothetical protein